MSRKKTILLSMLLSLPVILFVAHHYFVHSAALKPTGFTNEENVLYMSYSHQYLDQDKFSFTYSNPFDGNPASPRIYFQPVNFLFAGLMKLGMSPGFCLSLFGILMTICCIYTGIKILQHLLRGAKEIPFTAVLFTWGGGLTALTGLLASTFISGYATSHWIDGIYITDPANGWWGLNWGRTLFLPMEAYYHFIFLLSIYFILKKRWGAASLSALFLSLSHPFTGIEFLLIIAGWLLAEKIFFKNKDIPGWFYAAIVAITGLHVWYYLFFLNSFPEHKQLFSQYSEGWTYSLLIVVPAYCLVALLAAVNMYINRPVRKFLAMPHQRLFIVWALIAFLLSKHEWFIKPMQPIHFTRGYVWAGLFLFSLPAIKWLINWLNTTAARKLFLYLAAALFLSDNLLWTANHLTGKNNIEWEGHITKDTEGVLDYLKSSTNSNDLLVGNAPLVNYLANAYTSANVWASHPYNTPNREQRLLTTKQFLETGAKPDEWKGRRVVVVLKRNEIADWKLPVVFQNASYEIIIP